MTSFTSLLTKLQLFKCKLNFRLSLGSLKLSCLNRRDAAILRRLHIGHTRLTHQYLLTGEEPPQCLSCNCALTVYCGVVQAHLRPATTPWYYQLTTPIICKCSMKPIYSAPFDIPAVYRSAPRLRRRLMAATSLCDDLGTRWPSHVTFHHRQPCLCCCRTGCLEQPTEGRAVVHIAAAVLALAQGWALPVFPGPYEYDFI